MNEKENNPLISKTSALFPEYGTKNEENKEDNESNKKFTVTQEENQSQYISRKVKKKDSILINLKPAPIYPSGKIRCYGMLAAFGAVVSIGGIILEADKINSQESYQQPINITMICSGTLLCLGNLVMMYSESEKYKSEHNTYRSEISTAVTVTDIGGLLSDSDENTNTIARITITNRLQ